MRAGPSALIPREHVKEHPRNGHEAVQNRERDEAEPRPIETARSLGFGPQRAAPREDVTRDEGGRHRRSEVVQRTKEELRRAEGRRVWQRAGPEEDASQRELERHWCDRESEHEADLHRHEDEPGRRRPDRKPDARPHAGAERCDEEAEAHEVEHQRATIARRKCSRGYTRPTMLRRTAAIALVLVACTKADKEAPPIKRAEPLASASSAVVGAPADAAVAPFVAWTEPGGVESLLRGVPMSTDVKDPRSCYFDMPEQSCIPGSAAVLFGCRSDCARDCETCDKACRATLSACRKTGSAASCASTAGACVQGCLETRDGCATGKCAKEVADYEADVRNNFGCKDKKRRPFVLCEAASTCIEKCEGQMLTDAQRVACSDGCKKTHLSGCKEHILSAAETHVCTPLDDSP